MKALLLDAEYAPRDGVRPGSISGNDIWRYPHLSIVDRPDPSITSTDDTIVEVRVTGICGSDIHCIETDERGYIKFSGPAMLPRVIGHEFAGKVVAINPNVKNVCVGDLVAGESIQACFSCDNCRAGHLNVCKRIELLGLTKDGAFARYVRVRARHLYSVEPILKAFGDDRGFEIASMLEPIGVAYNAILKAPLSASESIVVFGAGPIGLSIIGLAKMFGARVCAFDILPERIKLAERMGADVSIRINSLATVAPAELVKEMTGDLAQKVFDATGDAGVFPQGLDCLVSRGTLIYVGRTFRHVDFDPNVIVSKELRVVGTRGHAGYDIFPTLIDLIARGRLNVGGMVTARFEFDQVLEAFELAKRRVDGKIVVKF